MPDRTPPDATGTPLDAAASALGISPDAARKRLERGTLRGEKRHGRWYVELASAPPPDAVSESTGRHPTGQADAGRTPPDAVSGPVRELIDHLKSENEYLRDQLDHSRRDLAAERERFDVIHREALSRIEALTAGQDAPGTAPNNRGEAIGPNPMPDASPENARPGATGDATGAAETGESHRESIGPPAWRRADEGHELGPDRDAATTARPW